MCFDFYTIFPSILGSGLYPAVAFPFLRGRLNTGMLFSLVRIVMVEFWDLVRALTIHKPL